MVATDPVPEAPADILTVVVCDAGPLIHLDQLNSLDLLADFPRVLVPTAVWNEFKHHRPSALVQTPLKLECIDPARNISPRLLALTQLFSLHHGETEALRVAQEQDVKLILTDDTAARLAAGNLQMNAHGTVGILARAVRRNQRTPEQVVALLRSIPSLSTLHIRPKLLESVIRRVETGE